MSSLVPFPRMAIFVHQTSFKFSEYLNRIERYRRSSVTSRQVPWNAWNVQLLTGFRLTPKLLFQRVFCPLRLSAASRGSCDSIVRRTQLPGKALWTKHFRDYFLPLPMDSLNTLRQEVLNSKRMWNLAICETLTLVRDFLAYKTPWPLASKRTISTERPILVGGF
jgi:hypothetical protein